jgi:uncharacterized membrane protein
MEEAFAHLARILASFVEAAAVIIVAFGCAEAFFKILLLLGRPAATHGERKAIWRRLGVWLLIGLEFELGADIMSSVFAPTWQEIGELGAIAVIRTFLNYFLEKDLENAEHAAALQDASS